MSNTARTEIEGIGDEISLDQLKDASGGAGIQLAVIKPHQVDHGFAGGIIDSGAHIGSPNPVGDLHARIGVEVGGTVGGPAPTPIHSTMPVDSHQTPVGNGLAGLPPVGHLGGTVDGSVGNSNVGASGSAHSGISAGGSAGADIGTGGVNAHAEGTVQIGVGASGEVHAGPAHASGSVEVGVGGSGSATVGVDGSHTVISGGAEVHAGANGQVSAGVGGSAGHVDAGANGQAGLSATAHGGGGVQYGNGQYGAAGGAGAEAAAGASGSVGGSAGIGNVGSAGGTVGGGVGGVGAHVDGHAGYDNGTIHAGFDIGGELGIGVDLGVNVSINTGGVVDAANTVAHGATDAANTVAHGATDAANTVAHGATNAANTVASGVSSAANTVASGVSSAANTVASGISSAASAVGNALNPGRVICTHFYRKGMLDRETWRADLEFTYTHLSPATVRGYQAWAIPYVRLMRRSPLAEKIMYPLARHRALELAYKMGRAEKGSLFGKIVRHTLEPVCFAIGLFVGEQNWQSLWVGTELEGKRSV